MASLYENCQFGLGCGSTFGSSYACHFGRANDWQKFFVDESIYFWSTAQIHKAAPTGTWVFSLHICCYACTTCRSLHPSAQTFPKGAKILSRRLWTWGVLRAEQFGGECVCSSGGTIWWWMRFSGNFWMRYFKWSDGGVPSCGSSTWPCGLFWQGHLKQGTPKTWKGMLTLQCMRCSWTIFADHRTCWHAGA